MGAQITFFRQFTPNISGGRFCFPANVATRNNFNQLYYNYIMAKEDNFDLGESYTFSIYDDHIDILSSFQRFYDYHITYIAITYEGYNTFYFVDRLKQISGGTRIFIRSDDWANYIGSATIKNITFTRSNKQVNPVKDELYLTDNAPQYDGCIQQFFTAYGNNTRVFLQALKIYATIKHRTISTVKTQIDEIHTYEFDPLENSLIKVLTRERLQSAIDNITAIFEDRDTKGAAELIHLYLFPGGIIPKVTRAAAFNTVLRSGTQTVVTGTEIDETVILYNIRYRNVELGFTPNYDNTVYIPNLGRKSYFGTKYNGIELPPFVGLCGVTFRIETKQDGITFLAVCGADMRDITTAFALTAIANTGTLTSEQLTAKWLGVIAGTASGAFQIAAGGAGVVTGGLTIANTINSLYTQRNGTYLGGGGAMTTFKEIIDNGAGDYLYISVNDPTAGVVTPTAAIEKVKTSGADCFYKYENSETELISIINTNEARQGYLISGTAYPVIACECTVNGIPYEAAEMIQSLLSGGVRLWLI